MRTYLDGNSIGHAASARKGMKLKAGAQETTAIFGALTSVRKILESRTAAAPVVLWDGRSWRHQRYEGYKAGRTKTAEQIAERERYRAQKKFIIQGLHFLGVSQLIAGNMEADDLAAIMTKRMIAKGETVALITGDKDWLQLVRPGVVWIDHKLDRKCNAAEFKDFTGYDTTTAFVHSKALQGDAGDSVPGCGGIGEKGALELLKVFPCVRTFQDMDLEVAQHAWGAAYEGKSIPAKFMKLRTDPEVRANFDRGLELMDLNHPSIPLPVGLKATRSRVDKEGFEKLCAQLAFSSILRDTEAFLKPFRMIEEEFSK